MLSFQRALMPVAEQLKEFADLNPVLFVSYRRAICKLTMQTFLATFTLLSAIPVLIFV